LDNISAEVVIKNNKKGGKGKRKVSPMPAMCKRGEKVIAYEEEVLLTVPRGGGPPNLF